MDRNEKSINQTKSIKTDRVSDQADLGTMCPAEDALDINSFQSNASNNLEVFSNLATELCEQLQLKEDPEQFLKTQATKTSQIKKQIQNLELDIFKTESEIKLFRQKCEKNQIVVVSVKELIDECICKLDQLTLEKESIHKKIKSKHSALKEACKFYKKNLDIYVKISEVNTTKTEVQLCFFTSKLDDTYSVVLDKDVETGTWGIVSVKPKFDDQQFTNLKQQLQETNNIVAFICGLKQLFNCLKNK